mgnify:CR=1 FL=1
MTKEQALQYTKYAAKKALDELEKQRSVRFTLKDEIPSVFESKIGGVPISRPMLKYPLTVMGIH